MRFALARRLLGAVTGRDLLAPDIARGLDYGEKAAYRWESGEDRPRAAAVERFASMCQEAGLPITAGWLERGETELPPIVIPAGALFPSAEDEEREEEPLPTVQPVPALTYEEAEA